MYYDHFGLKEPPFKITPNTDFFYTGGNRGAVLDALTYAIANGEGIIKVVGEVGSGKTMLCRMLQAHLPSNIESIYLANPSVAPEDVLHAIAFELQLKLPKNANRLTVMQVLQAHLLKRHAEGCQVVIFVEEAQGMPLATLEEIRLLSNLETKQDKLLQIVLFGQPELDDNLNKTHIRQLRERITHSFKLAPMHRKDIGEYLMFRLKAAGYRGPPIFSASAINVMAKAAKGLMRRVNILADKALLAAYAQNTYLVTPKHVKAAIQDSEFGQAARKQKTIFWTIAAAFGLSILLLLMWWLVGKQTAPESNQAVTKPALVAKPQIQSAPLAPPPAKQNTTDTAASPVVPTNPIAEAPPIDAISNAKPEHPQTATLSEARIASTQAWLQTASPNTLTIQIKSVAVESELNAELQRLAQQLPIEVVYLYRKESNTMPYTIILYGAFARRTDALLALETLPESIKVNGPYLRTVGGIQKDLQPSP